MNGLPDDRPAVMVRRQKVSDTQVASSGFRSVTLHLGGSSSCASQCSVLHRPYGRTVATAAAARVRRLPASSDISHSRGPHRAQGIRTPLDDRVQHGKILAACISGEERRPGWSGRPPHSPKQAPLRGEHWERCRGGDATSRAIAAACGVTGSSGSPGSAAICGSILLSRSPSGFSKLGRGSTAASC